MLFAEVAEKGQDWVSIIPSMAWLAFAAIMVCVYRARLRTILDALSLRIQAGAPFAVGPINIGAPPQGLGNTVGVSATAEGVKGTRTPADVERMLVDRHYPSELSEDVYLVHTAEVLKPYAGSQTGRWRVRVSVESYDDEGLLDEITRVTYRLHDTFKKKVIATEARESAFELWLNVFGEFNLIAYVERKDKSPLWLTRYIDLPGRPTN